MSCTFSVILWVQSKQDFVVNYKVKVILYYGIHNSILICKWGVVAAYSDVWECVVEQWLGVCRMLSKRTVSYYSAYNAHLASAPQHIPTQHDMLPQHFICKYELNCEYCNITLARNKAPWWWSDKIETCRGVLKCFKVF